MLKPEIFDVKLLYVEDEDDTREELEDFLSFRFKQLRVAKNGEEGLEIYKEYKPDILITDIMMPKMNGLEMIKAIEEEYGKPLVLVMTAFKKSDTNMEMIHSYGIEHILSKPVNQFEVIEEIKKLLVNKHEKY